MSISTERKTLNLNKCSVNEMVNEWIEQDIIVPDTKPDAVKIVNVTVSPYVSDVEVMDGKIKVIGKINYFVIYNVDDPRFSTRGLFVTYPYTKTLDIKGATKGCDVCVIPITKNVIHALPNERKIAIKTEVCFKVKLKTQASISLINKFEADSPIESKMCQSEFNHIVVDKKSIIASKDDVMLPKDAEDFFEILKMNTKIKNTEYKESYNKIMVKGDIEADIVYLSEDAEEPIKKMPIVVPFSAMIEIENIGENSKFDIRYLMQDFNLKVNEDITSSKTMRAEYQIEVQVVMYEEQLNEYIEDFYSQTKELRYQEETIDVVKKQEEKKRVLEITENVSNILPANTKLLDYSVDVSSLVPTLNIDTIHIDGNAKVSLLILNIEDMKLENKTIDVLVNEEFKSEQIDLTSHLFIDIRNPEISVIQHGNDLEMKIMIAVYTIKEDIANIKVIDNITEEKIDNSNLDSMNIYIVKPKDTLWAIAKKYKTSIEKIASTNDIEDTNNIAIGQKILIIR
ncbi:MAG: DUF3794 domain-containing protein [Clostridia bacterium]